MHYAIIITASFLGGAALATGYHAREVAIARRLLAAWKKGAATFKVEVSAVEAEFKHIFHVK